LKIEGECGRGVGWVGGGLGRGETP
jgi:hypothetical protein